MNIYLLYEADAWLSTDSKELIGVFTTEKQLFKAVKSSMRNRFKCGIFDRENESITTATNRMFDEFVNNGYQTQSYPINLFAENVETNKIL